MTTIPNLQTTRNWHNNHYEHTTPDSHQSRWRQFIEIDPSTQRTGWRATSRCREATSTARWPSTP